MCPVLLLTLLLILRCQAICEDGGLPIIRLRQGNRDVVEQVHVRAAERRGHLEAAPDPAEGCRILVHDADGADTELQRFVERSLFWICRDGAVLSCPEISIWFSLRPCRSRRSSVNFLDVLQGKSFRNFGRIFRVFLDPQNNKGLKISGEFRSTFCRNSVTRKKHISCQLHSADLPP